MIILSSGAGFLAVISIFIVFMVPARALAPIIRPLAIAIGMIGAAAGLIAAAVGLCAVVFAAYASWAGRAGPFGSWIVPGNGKPLAIALLGLGIALAPLIGFTVFVHRSQRKKRE